jgi:chromosome segregation ATPase
MEDSTEYTQILQNQLNLCGNRVSELEQEKEEWEEELQHFKTEVRRLTDENVSLKSELESNRSDYEEMLRDMETQVKAEKEKRLDNIDAFEKSKSKFEVRVCYYLLLH